jgi:hypothetical protein
VLEVLNDQQDRPGPAQSSQHAKERLAHPRAALAGRLKLGRIQVYLAPLQASPDLWHERCNVVRPRADYVFQLRVGGQLKGGGEGIMQRSVGDPRSRLGALCPTNCDALHIANTGDQLVHEPCRAHAEWPCYDDACRLTLCRSLDSGP